MSRVLSVVICTHDPRRELLQEALAALRAQTLSPDRWDLVVVDNASKEPVENALSLDWHGAARIVVEPRLGLIHARLRGIVESCAPTIVFIDDDNILDPDYLCHVLEIAGQYRHIGAWGGQGRARFEADVPAHLMRFVRMLALREAKEDRWGNVFGVSEITPWGAGLCVRRDIAAKFAETAKSDPWRLRLGRTGTSLVSCEDMDLAYTAVDLGYGMGVFARLKFTHVIPAVRLTDDYIVRLHEANAYSHVWLNVFRGRRTAPIRRSLPGRLLHAIHRIRMDRLDRRIDVATERGLNRACSEIEEIAVNRTASESAS